MELAERQTRNLTCTLFLILGACTAFKVKSDCEDKGEDAPKAVSDAVATLRLDVPVVVAMTLATVIEADKEVEVSLSELNVLNT